VPIFAAVAKNTMLNALAVDALSLHGVYNPFGGSEIAGGTPAYARLPATFAAAAAGIKLLTGVPYIFDVPPGQPVAWIGMWAAGTFVGMAPNAGGSLKPFVIDDLGSSTVESAAHGFLVGDSLVVWAGSAGYLPGGLVEGVIYYVITVTVDTLVLSATLAGAALSVIFTGNGYLQRIVSVTYLGQDHFVLNGLSLDATVAA
jgi:hypothetical protein